MKLTEQGLEQLLQLVKDNQSIYEIEYIENYLGSSVIIVWRNDLEYKLYPRANTTDIYVEIHDPYCDSYFDSTCDDFWTVADVLKLIRPYFKKTED